MLHHGRIHGRSGGIHLVKINNSKKFMVSTAAFKSWS